MALPHEAPSAWGVKVVNSPKLKRLADGKRPVVLDVDADQRSKLDGDVVHRAGLGR
jgi:hypothetical protein